MADELDVNVKEIVLNKMEKTAKKYPLKKLREFPQNMINYR